MQQKYLRNMEAGTMPLMNNHNVLKEMAEKATTNNQTRFLGGLSLHLNHLIASRMANYN